MLSGIYCIESHNGCLYYGSSINVEKRIKQHKYALRKNKHVNPHLQNAFNVYGDVYFSFYVVECVPITALKSREKHWISFAFATMERNKVYNVAKDTYSPMLGRTQTEETRRKISKSHTGKIISQETRNKLSKINRGKKHTASAKEKIALSSAGRKMPESFRVTQAARMTGRLVSDETRSKISAAAKLQKRNPMSEEARAKIGAAVKAAAIKRRMSK